MTRQIGLLECDHVPAHLRSIQGDYRDMFRRLFPDLNFRDYDVVNNRFPQSVSDCEAYIATGSRYSVYDQQPWIKKLGELVQRIHAEGKYFVGICFGHQILAQALGGQVRKNEKGWCVGSHTFTLLEGPEWMQPAKQSFNLLMSCQDQVTMLPPGSTLLAQADDCPTGMFQVGPKMLGVQGHPEYPKAFNQALMEERRHLIGATKVGEGIQSLSGDLDAGTFAQWVYRFLDLDSGSNL
ncbi:MAG: hypothetical protein OEQ53_14440 [Saprospiraceae bacterium]|nr:hypothetical protein [Saprospiraceae bacterium]